MANGLVNASLYAMLAVGFGIVLRSFRVFHVAYGGLYVISAYTFHALATRTHMPLGAAFVLTLIFAAIAGWATEKSLYRPFYRKGASPGTTLIASLGVSVVMENLIAMIFGNEMQLIPRGAAQTHRFGPMVFTEIQLLQLGVGVAVVLLVWAMVRRLRTFKAIWAMGDQPELIPVLGFPILKLRSLSLMVGTTLTAIPASLIYLDIGTDPHVGMSYMLIAAVAVLVGGIDSFAGWVCGASVLAILQSIIVWKFSA